MFRHSILIIFLFGVMTSAATVATAQDSDATTTRSKLAVQRRDAARKTYETMWANYRERRASDEVLYRWSKRWLKAERQLGVEPARQIAAFKAHLQRMRDLERIINNLQRSRQTTVDEVSAVEFYRAEAELWLLQARQEKKDR